VTGAPEELRLRQRWTPWWLGLPLVALYLIGGWFLVRTMSDPQAGARIFLPSYGLLAALVLPAGLNQRVITASVRGVRVRNNPFPKGRTVDLARREIYACTVRTQHSSFYSESADVRRIANYVAGVETRAAQVDVAYPYLKQEDALAVAQQIAAALNADRTLPPIAVREASMEPDLQPGWRLRVVKWLGLFVVAILAGAAWEFQRVQIG
jgi:hypothetical protein